VDAVVRGILRQAARRTTMSLEVKAQCEHCLRPLAREDEAWICSYQCTFCGDCCRELGNRCPNCGGGLLRRPCPQSIPAT